MDRRRVSLVTFWLFWLAWFAVSLAFGWKAAAEEPIRQLGPVARWEFVPGANAAWHEIEVRDARDGAVETLSLAMPVNHFRVERRYGSTWTVRVRGALTPDGERGPWSDWSRPVTWLGPNVDYDGNDYIGAADLLLLRRVYGCYVCGVECRAEPCSP